MTTVTKQRAGDTNPQNLKLIKQKIGSKNNSVIDENGHPRSRNNSARSLGQQVKILPRTSDQFKITKPLSSRLDESDNGENQNNTLPTSFREEAPSQINSSRGRNTRRLSNNFKERFEQTVPIPLALKTTLEPITIPPSSNNQASSPPSITRTLSPMTPRRLGSISVPVPVPVSVSVRRSSSRELPTPITSSNQMPNHEISKSASSKSEDFSSARSHEVGLQNLGNTCFMNSSLQCLLHIEPLMTYFLSNAVSTDLNPASPMKGSLALSFSDLAKEFISTNDGEVISPNRFQKTVSVYAPHLLDFQQQDCQEFLRFLLDGMSEDLCRSRQPTVPTSSKNVESSGEEAHPSPPSRRLSINCLRQQSGLSSSSSPITIVDDNPDEAVAKARRNVASSNAPIDQEDKGQRTTKACDGQPSQTVSRLRAATQSSRSAHIVGDADDNAETATAAAADSNRNLTLLGDTEDDSTEVEEPAVNSPDNKQTEHSENKNFGGSTGSIIELKGKKSFNDDLAIDRLAPLPVIEVPEGKQPFSLMRSLTLSGLRTRPRSTGSGKASGRTSPDTSARDREADSARSVEERRKVIEEATKAWDRYLEKNDSVITDLFAGQLQSTIECDVCHNRSSCFDPFLDLSVPIPRICELTTTSKGWRRGSCNDASKCSLDECVEKLIGEEVLEGDNMVECDKCKKKTRSVRRLFVFRYPRVLVIHIKRFRYSTYHREKLSTDVNFPMSGFELSPYLSPDLKHSTGGSAGGGSGQSSVPPVYDLLGVSHHSGSLHGGHYTALVDTAGVNGVGARWMCFNDARVSQASVSSLSGPSAYVLFYLIRSSE